MVEVEGFVSRLEEAQFALELLESEAGEAQSQGGGGGSQGTAQASSFAAAEQAALFQEALSGLAELDATLEVGLMGVWRLTVGGCLVRQVGGWWLFVFG